MSRLKELIRGKPAATPEPSTEVPLPERTIMLSEQVQKLAEEILAEVDELKG